MVLILRHLFCKCKQALLRRRKYTFFGREGGVHVEFLSVQFKATKTNDIIVSILGLYFLEQFFNPGKKKFHKFIIAFIFRKKISCAIW